MFIFKLVFNPFKFLCEIMWVEATLNAKRLQQSSLNQYLICLQTTFFVLCLSINFAILCGNTFSSMCVHGGINVSRHLPIKNLILSRLPVLRK